MIELDIHDVFRIFGNKNRVLMLRELKNNGGRATHSDLSYRIGLNPKSTKDHLSVLMKYEIIEKLEKGYGLTAGGTHLVGLLVEDNQSKDDKKI